MKRVLSIILIVILSVTVFIRCYSDSNATEPKQDISEELPFNKYQLDDMTVYKFYLSGVNYIVVKNGENVSITKE